MTKKPVKPASKDKAVVFLAYFPPTQSAITLHGHTDGMRITLEIPENQVEKALPLLAMRQLVFRVTIQEEPGRAIV